MRRPIVVAVDGSEASLRAAEWAAREATRRGAPLRVVSAPGRPPRPRTSATSTATVANALRGIAARGLAAAVERITEVAPGVVVDTGLLDGPPAVAITASGAGADLLVVGARGAGGSVFPSAQTSRASPVAQTSRASPVAQATRASPVAQASRTGLLPGSVSGYVAACAACPTVVVREETVAARREIVVGVRDPADADAALGFAFEEAALRGANLTAVHATSATAGTEAARRYLEAALHGWRDKYPEVRVTPDVARCHPARVLVSLSARADLVIIGRHGTVGAPAGGSVHHAVLSHAYGPVAIVPAGEAA